MMQLSPDGRFYHDAASNTWQPMPTAAPAPPPPPPTMQAPPPPYATSGYVQTPPGYPPQQQQPPYAPPAPAYAMPQQQAQTPWAPPAAAPATGGYGNAATSTLAQEYAGGLDFNDPAVSGAASLPEGDHVARVDDIEFGTSKATPPNDKAQFKVTLVGGPTPNRTGIWSYTLTPKSIFRLGKDLVKLNLGLRPNGAKWSPDARTLCGELLQELRGKLLKLRVSPQIDRDTKLPSAEGYVNVLILGWAEGIPQNTAPPAYGVPNAVVPSPGIPMAVPQVTYPNAPTPPPPPGSMPGFHQV